MVNPIRHEIFDLDTADAVIEDGSYKNYYWLEATDFGETRVLSIDSGMYSNLVIYEVYAPDDAFDEVFERILSGAKITKKTDRFRKFMKRE